MPTLARAPASRCWIPPSESAMRTFPCTEGMMFRVVSLVKNSTVSFSFGRLSGAASSSFSLGGSGTAGGAGGAGGAGRPREGCWCCRCEGGDPRRRWRAAERHGGGARRLRVRGHERRQREAGEVLRSEGDLAGVPGGDGDRQGREAEEPETDGGAGAGQEGGRGSSARQEGGCGKAAGQEGGRCERQGCPEDGRVPRNAEAKVCELQDGLAPGRQHAAG
mmetsp:Transcript_59621/g.169447  ORF Transcript_59621/g.169447 Transcript_59621/m.169447 type:complete len:220 (-) Transcript_59621:635-1294(-)